MAREELLAQIYQASKIVKLVCGIGNNAAWMVALDGLDHARQCRRYSNNVRHQFKRCEKLFHDYERNLLHATQNRMFHVADMPPEIRKKYGDITDRDFYDMWAAIGSAAYVRTKPLITSLWNKYRLALVENATREAEHIAWVMTAMACLNLAVEIYDKALDECENGLGVPRRFLIQIFGQFSLKRICKTWGDAMEALIPEANGHIISHTRQRNIQMGLDQLLEAWTNTEHLYGSVSDTVEDYDDLFRTKGEAKKALREIAEVKEETEREMMNDR